MAWSFVVNISVCLASFLFIWCCLVLGLEDMVVGVGVGGEDEARGGGVCLCLCFVALAGGMREVEQEGECEGMFSLVFCYV